MAAIVPGSKPMAAITGFCFVAVGSGLLALRAKRFALSAGVAVALLGLMELIALSLDPAWGRWGARGDVLFHPVITTAPILLLLGLGLISGARGWPWLTHVFATGALLASATLLFGYALRVPIFVDPSRIVATVVATAAGALLLAIAELVVAPRGWMATLTSRSTAATMGRFLLPVAILVPLAGVRIVDVAEHWAGYTVEAGMTFLVVINATFSAATILIVASVLQSREQRARELDEQYRIVAENLPQKIGLKDASGTWISVNENLARDLGVRPNEVAGKRDQDFFPNDLAEKYRADDRRVLESGRTLEFDEEYVRDGERRIVHTVKTRITRGGAPGILLIFWDITEKKLADERLARSLADLERSNKELEQFAYVASHDLQEPLRMVSSYTQLLERRYGDRLDADAKDFIGFAVDGANRMQRLINDLLAYSRVGTRGREPRPVDSHAALGEAIANLGPVIEESGAMVSTDQLPVVRADDGQLEQLFRNLIGNAIKFHRPNVAPRVHLSAKQIGGSYEFAVRDNGIGIAPEFHSRLFVIFQRLHGRDEYPGTGIGLAICKRIVERHGGTMRIESQGDDGATFFFTLPAAKEAA